MSRWLPISFSRYLRSATLSIQNFVRTDPVFLVSQRVTDSSGAYCLGSNQKTGITSLVPSTALLAAQSRAQLSLTRRSFRSQTIIREHILYSNRFLAYLNLNIYTIKKFIYYFYRSRTFYTEQDMDNRYLLNTGYFARPSQASSMAHGYTQLLHL